MTTQAISDYALIGDCETAALVGRNGSIDWLCWPRFDSGACFAALLGRPEHGRWQIAPDGAITSTHRRYLDDTLILETTFETEGGAVSVTDFMPIRRKGRKSVLVRIVTGLRGQVGMGMDLAFRFDYGRIVPWVSKAGDGRWRAIAGPHAVYLDSPVPLHGEDLRTRFAFNVTAGERLAFTLTYEASHLPLPHAPDAEAALADTRAFWQDWAAQCCYKGPWRAAVMRSLITVKALTYSPTGGIVAAPTTSLPEKLGGARNWDYRYCWLRDATFTLLSLLDAGYRDEAEAWCDWLLRAVAGVATQIQPLYGIGGEHRNDEVVLDWLPGYAGSRPVRIGNAAYRQLQVDVFGSVMDTLHQARLSGLKLNDASDELQRKLLERLEEEWREPDEGLWEVRSGRQHFVHAKLMSWVAFDRAVLLAEDFGLTGPVERWRALRDEIRAEILARGWSEARGAFVQAYDSEVLDASVLLMPMMGFLPPDDPRILSTTRAIERGLTRDGLVLRYDTDQAVDGLEGDEGAFLACSFWLVDNLVMQGRHDDARALFERLLSLRNDLGLLAEQWDWHTGQQVGNFPQAFSHFAMIDTAFTFSGFAGLARENTD
ncbi:MAG TPA: glycoside hydrolase family 15 protein [Paracoccus sp.]|nr:glycoside hydrolase family 15 protein [Paracoccus sp. (in: a-proteobacteria)]